MDVEFKELIGKIILKIIGDISSDCLIFYTIDRKYIMQHIQDCCESVSIDDIVGDLKDLIGSPIVFAEETNNHDNPKRDYDESFKWTFYNISTIKGSVTIKWYGTSNGYYSENVDVSENDLTEDEKQNMMLLDNKNISFPIGKLKRRISL